MVTLRLSPVEGAGVHEIDLNHTIRAHTGLGLADAKQVVGDLLDGKHPMLRFEASETASRFVEAAQSPGARAELVGDD